MKNQDYINELLGRYFAKEELDREQQKELELWMESHPEEFRKLKKVMAHTEEKLHTAPMFNAELAWKKVEPKLKTQRQLSIRPWKVMTAIAASLVIVMLAVRLIPNSKSLHYENRTASIQNILLPDSSEVTLFPNATLDCRIAENDGDRKVNMNGKVFFKVKRSKGRRFQIKAEETFVEVLGTSFIVDASQKSKTKVQVRSGKVKVSSGSSEVELEKNEQVEISGSKITMKTIDQPAQVFGFVEKELVVQNEPITEVVKDIETLTGVQITLESAVSKNKITTRLDLNQIEQIVKELANLCQCQYEKTDSYHYRLFSK